MADLAIGVVATLLSTIIIGLFGALIIRPYNAHQEIYKKILRFIRNFDDPRNFEGQLIPTSLMVDCIDSQIKALQEILDLMGEQEDLNRLLYRLFKYGKLTSSCVLVFEYVRNPIMLKETKEFEDDYRLDTDKFFKGMKKTAKFPWGRFLLIALCLMLLLVGTIILAFKMAIT